MSSAKAEHGLGDVDGLAHGLGAQARVDRYERSREHAFVE